MSGTSFAEPVVEDAALAWLEWIGFTVPHGPDIAAGEPGAERGDPNCGDVLLEGGIRVWRSATHGAFGG